MERTFYTSISFKFDNNRQKKVYLALTIEQK